MKEKITHLKFFIDAVANFARHDGMVMAGHLAFLTMLALFPFIIFLVSLAGLFGQSEAGIQAMEHMFAQMPEDVAGVLRKPMNNLVENTDKSILTFSIVGAIWISSTAIDAARLAVVRAYETISHRSIIRRRTEGLLLVILSASAIIIGMTILVLGPVAWNILIKFIPVDADWKYIWNLVRLLASLLLIFGALCLSYYILKPRNLRMRPPVMAGAVITLVLWMAIGSGFSLYLKYFGNYDVTYGSLAGAIIALIFFYVISVSFILGAEVNAALYRQQLRKMGKDGPGD